MVKNILNFLNREITGLHQAAYLLGFFAICSQVLALFRDRMLASQFGAGDTLDLYYSAFRIPDILFATVASIVSISVLIPFLFYAFCRTVVVYHRATYSKNSLPSVCPWSGFSLACCFDSHTSPLASFFGIFKSFGVHYSNTSEVFYLRYLTLGL